MNTTQSEKMPYPLDWTVMSSAMNRLNNELNYTRNISVLEDAG